MKPFFASILKIGIPVFVLSLVPIALFSYYTEEGVPPADVASTIITCARTVCTAQATSPACAQLSEAVTGCLSSGVNAAVCLAGVPSLVSVGYADVACVVAALASAPPKPIAYRTFSKSIDNPEDKSGESPEEIPDVRQQAIGWLKTQRIVVNP